MRKALDLAFSWPRHDERTLGDLVERLDGMPDEGDRLSIWNVIDDWSRTETDEKARAQFRSERCLSRALDSLDGRPGVTVDEMAQLEFAFIQALDHSEHGIPNLERKVTESPLVFVQALALLFKTQRCRPGPARVAGRRT